MKWRGPVVRKRIRFGGTEEVEIRARYHISMNGAGIPGAGGVKIIARVDYGAESYEFAAWLFIETSLPERWSDLRRYAIGTTKFAVQKILDWTAIAVEGRTGELLDDLILFHSINLHSTNREVRPLLYALEDLGQIARLLSILHLRIDTFLILNIPHPDYERARAVLASRLREFAASQEGELDFMEILKEVRDNAESKCRN